VVIQITLNGFLDARWRASAVVDEAKIGGKTKTAWDQAIAGRKALPTSLIGSIVLDACSTHQYPGKFP
jgi:hypothetical protein